MSDERQTDRGLFERLRAAEGDARFYRGLWRAAVVAHEITRQALAEMRVARHPGSQWAADAERRAYESRTALARAEAVIVELRAELDAIRRERGETSDAQ